VDPLFQSVTFIGTSTIYYLLALVRDRAAPKVDKYVPGVEDFTLSIDRPGLVSGDHLLLWVLRAYLVGLDPPLDPALL
jgi:hypothetical protein